MTDVLNKFGRYFLLDQLAQGGMAEIYRARLASADGAGRLLVIKRIQGGYGSNSEFLQMFKSEIKVTMGFSHPNIVQLFDFGEEKDQPFIAMEFVDGKNLRQFLNRFLERKQRMPIDVAAYTIEQAARGLYYAHFFKDKITGQSLNIVHRDISPQNIIVSYEGGVKIIDFGIAKATTNSEHTRAGIIKGKPSYLSPEQISGDELDGRCDIFALGAVLWELLVGKKCFTGDNDLAILKMIESCNTTVRPPSEFNPEVPKELDLIVLRMLARNPDKRYQTGDECAKALRRFLAEYSGDFSSTDLSFIIKDGFQNEIVEDRKRIQRLNDRVEELLSTTAESTVVISQKKMEDVTQANASNPSNVSNISSEITRSHEDTTTFVAKRKEKNQEIKVEEKVLQQAPPVERVAPRPSSVSQRTRSTQVSAPRPLSKPQPASTSSSSVWLSLAALVLLGGGGFYYYQQQNKSASTIRSSTTREDSNQSNHSSNQKMAKIRLQVTPSGGSDLVVQLNNRNVGSSGILEVPLSEALDIVVSKKGYKSYQSQFQVTEADLNDQGEFIKEINLIEDRKQMADNQKKCREMVSEFKGPTGELNVDTSPSSQAIIFQEGQALCTAPTPIGELILPVGHYLIKFENVLGLKADTEADIEAGKKTSLGQISLKTN
jgi:serine/threonine-protein kinase